MGILSLIGGMLSVRFNKRLGKMLFISTLLFFAAGGLVFSLEKSGDAAAVRAFEAGGTLSCSRAGERFEVSLDKGWSLQGGDHFVKESTILRAAGCEAQP